MADLKNRRLIYLKGFLFLMILVTSSALIVLSTRNWAIAGLLVLAVWSSARLYYFMFYVIEKYVDGQYRFAGIGSFVAYLLGGLRETPDDDGRDSLHEDRHEP